MFLHNMVMGIKKLGENWPKTTFYDRLDTICLLTYEM